MPPARLLGGSPHVKRKKWVSRREIYILHNHLSNFYTNGTILLRIQMRIAWYTRHPLKLNHDHACSNTKLGPMTLPTRARAVSVSGDSQTEPARSGQLGAGSRRFGRRDDLAKSRGQRGRPETPQAASSQRSWSTRLEAGQGNSTWPSQLDAASGWLDR